jgi:hypothetical protein
MNQIAQAFRADFANWGLEIPPEALASREPGFIQAAGWLIQFTFGRDSRGEYIDYYASHRMTYDSHVRLYETGRRQRLASIAGMYATSSDHGEARRLEAVYLRRNKRVARKLAAKGFNKFSINMLLYAGLEGKATNPETNET